MGFRKFTAPRRRAPGVRLVASKPKGAMRVGPSVTIKPSVLRTLATKAWGRGQSTSFVSRRKKQNIKRLAPAIGIGGAGTFSSFKLTSPPSPRIKTMKRVGASNYYITNNAQQLSIKEGFQDAQFFSFQNFSDLKYVVSKIPGTSPVPRQFVLESTTAEFMLTNSTLATMYVDVYDIIRKRDPGYSATQDDSANPTRDPLNAWKVGVSDQSSAPPDFTAYQNLSCLPTDSRLFRDYFRVVKRTHISMAQGSTHRHHVKLAPNRLLDTEVTDRVNGDLKGVCIYTLIVAYGQPASVPNDVGAVVTTASGAIDVVVSQRMKYTWVADSTNSWWVVDNLASLAGEQVISAGSGTIVPNAKV